MNNKIAGGLLAVIAVAALFVLFDDEESIKPTYNQEQSIKQSNKKEVVIEYASSSSLNVVKDITKTEEKNVSNEPYKILFRDADKNVINIDENSVRGVKFNISLNRKENFSYYIPYDYQNKNIEIYVTQGDKEIFKYNIDFLSRVKDDEFVDVSLNFDSDGKGIQRFDTKKDPTKFQPPPVPPSIGNLPNFGN